jgi:hypothetical protein
MEMREADRPAAGWASNVENGRRTVPPVNARANPDESTAAFEVSGHCSVVPAGLCPRDSTAID